ncbi:hypothetical protein MTO96_001295 [Rhipicephalus appendiculatus]|uniref:Lipocalin n=1 Tax=Rhipicephalus appendiculatus TaxID=34631 RepID=A0A131YTS4_RHIAP
MQALALLFSAGLYVLPLGIPLAVGEAKHKLRHEVADASKVFEKFPSAVAIFDQDLDGDLDCVTAVRTDLNPETHESTYIWILKGLNGNTPENITLHVKPGATPDTFSLTTGNDNANEQTADFLYTDYKDCLVVNIPYKNTEQCMLWVADARKDDIPQSCVDYYEDNCDTEKTAYVKDVCSSS